MKTVKKLASILMALALFMQLIPPFTPHAIAVVPDTNFEIGLGLLLRGFNALAEAPVAGERDKRQVLGINFNTGIFNNDAFEPLRGYLWWDKISPITRSFSINENSVTQYAEKYGTTIGASVKGEFNIKDIFKLKVEQKWSQDNQSSISEAAEKMFFESTTWRREATYDIDFNAIPEDVIQAQLTETFKNDLLYASPEYIFNRYGTHFLTKYSLGGWIEAYVYSASNSVNRSFSQRDGFEGNVISVNEIRNDYGESSSTHVSDVVIYGGAGGVIHTTSKDTVSTVLSGWAASFKDATLYEILTMPSDDIPAPIFEGIWELLPDGHKDRYYELVEYYLEKSTDRDTTFFDNFVYNNPLTSSVTPVNNIYQTSGSLSGVIGTGASQIPANATYISNITQLAGIGNSASEDNYYVLGKP